MGCGAARAHRLRVTHTKRTIWQAYLAVVVFAALALITGCSGSLGTASASPGRLDVPSATLSFGNVQVGQSLSLSASLSAGSQPVTVTAANLSEPGFSVSGLALPLTISPGQHITYRVNFAPERAGPLTASIAFVSDASDATSLQMVSGTGYQPRGSLSGGPESLDFGSVEIGESLLLSASLSAGSFPVTVTAVSSSNHGFFLTGLKLPLVLPPGESIGYHVVFAPQSVGSITGNIAFVSNACTPPVVLTVVGTGIRPPGILGASPAMLNFGNVLVGGSSSRTVSLSANKFPVTVTEAYGSQPEFAVSGLALPLTILPGQSVAFEVTFTPQTDGARTGSASFVSNSFNSPFFQVLEGTGTVASGVLSAGPSPLDFGDVQVGRSASLSASLSAASIPITVTGVSASQPGWSTSGLVLPLTIAPGTTFDYTITFTPRTVGATTGSVAFVSNASDSPLLQIVDGNAFLPANAVSRDFFGVDSGHLSSPWPNELDVPMGIWRSLGAELRWSNLETCDGGSDPTNSCYNWASFDSWVNKAATNGQDVLYTAYYTPTWASSNPSAACQTAGLGGCYPPSDVENGDNYWKNFLTALYMHTVNTSGLEKIRYWECWNEPNVLSEYDNNDPANAWADLNTMCSDLQRTIHALDAGAKFTTPAPALGPGVVTWLTHWIGAGYANYADYIAFHGYVCKTPQTCSPNSADQIGTIILTPLEAVIAGTAGTANDVTQKPLWDTEGSDLAGNTPIQDPDLHAAFAARYMLVQQALNVVKFSYWGWDFTNGAELVNNKGTSTVSLNLAGIAWQQIYAWTAGWRFLAPCSSAGTVWQCGLVDASGDMRLAVWDESQTCSGGVCGTTSLAAPSGYTRYIDLEGNVNSILGGTVPVGAKPVMLE